GFPVCDDVLDVDEVPSLGPGGVHRETTRSGLPCKQLDHVPLRNVTTLQVVTAVDVALPDDRDGNVTLPAQTRYQLLARGLLARVLVRGVGGRAFDHGQRLRRADHREAAREGDGDASLTAHPDKPCRSGRVRSRATDRIPRADHGPGHRRQMEDYVTFRQQRETLVALEIP